MSWWKCLRHARHARQTTSWTVTEGSRKETSSVALRKPLVGFKTDTNCSATSLLRQCLAKRTSELSDEPQGKGHRQQTSRLTDGASPAQTIWHHHRASRWDETNSRCCPKTRTCQTRSRARTRGGMEGGERQRDRHRMTPYNRSAAVYFRLSLPRFLIQQVRMPSERWASTKRSFFTQLRDLLTASRADTHREA